MKQKLTFYQKCYLQMLFSSFVVDRRCQTCNTYRFLLNFKLPSVQKYWLDFNHASSEELFRAKSHCFSECIGIAIRNVVMWFPYFALSCLFSFFFMLTFLQKSALGFLYHFVNQPCPTCRK